MTSDQLNKVPQEEALELLWHRFPWLRSERAFVEQCIHWETSVMPKPGPYFRWNIPRFVTTLEIVEVALRKFPKPRVLDLSTFAPHAIMMERYLQAKDLQVEWVRTSYRGGVESFSANSHSNQVPTVALELGDARFPFKDAGFDLVILTEVIEHLHKHHQYTLAEINRVLRKGGFVLISTPNITSWKKVFALSNGDWDFDAPTFTNDWGHRYEYSFWQLRQILQLTGFTPEIELAKDVYFNDPQGPAQRIQLAGMIASKLFTGQFARAAKLWQRRGSGLFFLFRKTEDAHTPTPEQLMAI